MDQLATDQPALISLLYAPSLPLDSYIHHCIYAFVIALAFSSELVFVFRFVFVFIFVFMLVFIFVFNILFSMHFLAAIPYYAL